jgi:hypothetical protein
LILGSAAAPYLQGVWASEFIEEPAQPGYDRDGQPGSGEIGHIAGLLDNTTKTRALFEINKGVNKSASISVNDAIAEANRRVPFSNMVYIADGPSDIPSFSVVNKHGGYTLAVYDPADGRQFEQASRLHEMGRVQALAPADYQRDSHADRVLRRAVLRMAGAIVAEREDTLRRQVGPGPTHRDETRG